MTQKDARGEQGSARSDRKDRGAVARAGGDQFEARHTERTRSRPVSGETWLSECMAQPPSQGSADFESGPGTRRVGEDDEGVLIFLMTIAKRSQLVAAPAPRRRRGRTSSSSSSTTWAGPTSAATAATSTRRRTSTAWPRTACGSPRPTPPAPSARRRGPPADRQVPGPAAHHRLDSRPDARQPEAARARLDASTCRSRRSTLAEVFKAAGYATASIGKWHLGGEEYLPREARLRPATSPAPTAASRPELLRAVEDPDTLPEGTHGEYLTDRLADEAVQFIERTRTSRSSSTCRTSPCTRRSRAEQTWSRSTRQDSSRD